MYVCRMSVDKLLKLVGLLASLSDFFLFEKPFHAGTYNPSVVKRPTLNQKLKFTKKPN